MNKYNPAIEYLNFLKQSSEYDNEKKLFTEEELNIFGELAYLHGGLCQSNSLPISKGICKKIQEIKTKYETRRNTI